MASRADIGRPSEKEGNTNAEAELKQECLLAPKTGPEIKRREKVDLSEEDVRNVFK